MTTEELAKRRAWAASHFSDKNLTDEELETATYMPSENFSDGWDKGAEWALQKQWIPVDERLPEDDRLVIIHTDDLAYPSEISNCMGYYKDGTWQFPDDYYYDCHITHWMEIPQLNPGKNEL